MRIITDEKLQTVCASLRQRAIDVVWIDDHERSRDVSISYLTGHPNDATLLLFADGETALRPWDVPLARQMAQVTRLLDTAEVPWGSPQPLYDELKRKLGDGFTIEFTTRRSHHAVLQFQQAFPKVRVVCDAHGVELALGRARVVKSSAELGKLRAACELNNRLIDGLADFIRGAGRGVREVDLALHLETEMRRAGATGPSFETIVANVTRSFGIHAFPCASQELLAKQGCAILDFGVKLDGYCSDTTVPLAFGRLAPEQEKMLKAVREAYDEAVAMIKPGVPAHTVAERAVKVLERYGCKMPHGLGHGIGLEVHDPIRIAPKPTDPTMLANWSETLLEPGMVFTVEPGAYDPAWGGVRLENDVLVTATGCEILTRSRPLAFPELTV